MTNLATIKIFFSALALSSCAAHLSPVNPAASADNRTISMAFARAISYAYEDYSRFKADSSCIEVAYRGLKSRIEVSVYSKSLASNVESDEVTVTSGAGNRCGPHMRYDFDLDGSFIERIGIR